MLASLRSALLLLTALVALQSTSVNAGTVNVQKTDGKTPLDGAPAAGRASQTDLFCSKFTSTCFDVCLKGKKSGHVAVKHKCGRRTAAASTLASFDFRCRCPQDVTNTVLKRIGAGTTSISTLFQPTTVTLRTATASTPSLVTQFTTRQTTAVETPSRTVFETKLETAVTATTAVESSLTTLTSTQTISGDETSYTTTPDVTLTTSTSRTSTTRTTVTLVSPSVTLTTLVQSTASVSTFQTTRTVATEVTSTQWIDESSTQVVTRTIITPETSVIYKDVTLTTTQLETLVVPTTQTLLVVTTTSRVPFTTTTTSYATSYTISPTPTTVPLGLAIIDESRSSNRRGLLVNSKSTFCTAYASACSRQCARVKSTVGIQLCRRKPSLSPARQQYLMACRCRNGYLETQHALADAGNDVHVSVVTVLSTSTVESYTTTVTVPHFSTTLQTVLATVSTQTVEPAQTETVFFTTLTSTRVTVVETSRPESTITVPATAYSTLTQVVTRASPTTSVISTDLTEVFETTTTYEPTVTSIITTLSTDILSELSESVTTSTLTLPALATRTHVTTTTSDLDVTSSTTTTSDRLHTEIASETTTVTSVIPTTFTTTKTESEAIATSTVYETTVTVLAPTGKLQVWKENAATPTGYAGASDGPYVFYPFVAYNLNKASAMSYMLTTPDPSTGRYALQRADGSGLTQIAEVFKWNPVPAKPEKSLVERRSTFGENANVAWLTDVQPAVPQLGSGPPSGTGAYYKYPFETYFWVTRIVNGKLQIRPQWVNPDNKLPPTVLMARPLQAGVRELCIGGSVKKVNDEFFPKGAPGVEAVYYAFDFSP